MSSVYILSDPMPEAKAWAGDQLAAIELIDESAARLAHLAVFGDEVTRLGLTIEDLDIDFGQVTEIAYTQHGEVSGQELTAVNQIFCEHILPKIPRRKAAEDISPKASL